MYYMYYMCVCVCVRVRVCVPVRVCLCPPHKGRLPYKKKGRLQEGRTKGYTPTGYKTKARKATGR